MQPLIEMSAIVRLDPATHLSRVRYSSSASRTFRSSLTSSSAGFAPTNAGL